MLFAGVAFLLPDQVVGTLLKLQYFQSLGFQSSLVRCHLVAFFFFSSLLAWWDRRCFPFFVSQWYSSSYSFFDAGKITFIPALGALLTGKVSLKVMPGVFGSNHAVVGHFSLSAAAISGRHIVHCGTAFAALEIQYSKGNGLFRPKCIPKMRSNMSNLVLPKIHLLENRVLK